MMETFSRLIKFYVHRITVDKNLNLVMYLKSGEMKSKKEIEK